MVAALDKLLADPNLVGEDRYMVLKTRRALHRQRAGLEPLKFSDSLFMAAADHCADGEKNGIVGDVGTDGSFPSERVGKYAKSMGVEQQVVNSPQTFDTIESLVQAMVVKLDLAQIFSPHAKFAGIATCPHKTEDGFTVMVSAESVVPTKATLQRVQDLIKQS